MRPPDLTPAPDANVAPVADGSERKLSKLSVEELQALYTEVVGRSSGSSDRRYLVWKVRQAQKGRIPVGPVRRRHADGEAPDMKVRRLIAWLRAETARATGRRYQIDFDALDVQSLRELVRLVRDLEHEKQAAVNRARMMPWRRQ